MRAMQGIRAAAAVVVLCVLVGGAAAAILRNSGRFEQPFQAANLMRWQVTELLV